MKGIRYILLAVSLSYSILSTAQVQFSGNSRTVYTETPAASTGLDYIYVLYDASGVSMSYTAQNAQNSVVWYKYGSMGGGYAEEISGITKNGNVTTLNSVIGNCGYIIEEGTTRTYLWVVNYKDYYLELSGISFAETQDCGTTQLNVTGSGNDIIYYTINGVSQTLDRNITLEYRTLSWSGDNTQWTETTTTESYEVFKSSIVIQAPYCDTEFTLKGDKFLQYWELEESITSDTYSTNSVAVETTAVQETRENLNEKTVETTTGYGGSAPVTITFTAYCTDAATHKEWQVATDSEFSNLNLRLYEDEIVQTFNTEGTYYVKFIGTNSTGDCSAESTVYTVTIGTSSLECPNAFSPQSTQGVNDEWKVSYKSIIEFKCWIFNRWGIQICELTDPSQGWDGKYKGKYVKSGTYYYVIQAKGADGQEYNLKGDINIINYSGENQ